MVFFLFILGMVKSELGLADVTFKPVLISCENIKTRIKNGLLTQHLKQYTVKINVVKMA